jgi:hypothetical protein
MTTTSDQPSPVSRFTCPSCSQPRNYVNVVNGGRTHIGYCQPCGMSWIIGANLFDNRRCQTEAEYDRERPNAGTRGVEDPMDQEVVEPSLQRT